MIHLHGLAAFLYAAMIAWAPPALHAYTGASQEITEARYASIAQDLADVALDPEEEPLFAGDVGRAQTALLMLAITRYESGGWRADIDNQKPSGDCSGGKCRAACLAQLQGIYAEDLSDRKSCFRAELRALRDSWALCSSPSWKGSDRMTGYTVGRCEEGEHGARLRFKLATSWWKDHPFLPPVP